MTDWHAAIGPDVREAPAETLHDVEGGGAWACPARWTGGDGEGTVCEAPETSRGAGDSEARRGQGGAGRVALGMGLPRDMPRDGPGLGVARLQQPGVAPGVFAEGSGEGGERCDGHQAVGAGGQPGRAVRCEAPARDEGGERGVGLQRPAPGGQEAGNTGAAGVEDALVVGEPGAGRGGGRGQGVVREVVRRAEQGPQGFGDGKGAEAGRPGKRSLHVGRKPLLGCRLRPRGPGPGAPGRRAAVWRAPAVARREAVAIGPAGAMVASAADLARRGGQSGRGLQGLWRTGGEARAAGRHGRSPGMRGLRRS